MKRYQRRLVLLSFIAYQAEVLRHMRDCTYRPGSEIRPPEPRDVPVGTVASPSLRRGDPRSVNTKPAGARDSLEPKGRIRLGVGIQNDPREPM